MLGRGTGQKMLNEQTEVRRGVLEAELELLPALIHGRPRIYSQRSLVTWD
jgi:hypothetical protein